jgi:5-histidylcysteine sulfoxide synthase/putative 4-mercaptohistidine N1-methyltranferase
MQDRKVTKTLVLNQSDPKVLREQVRDYFHSTFSIDERLYDSIAREEGFYLRADPLRHPLVFYLGHTAVFYINKLNIAQIVSRRINPAFESMFAVGVDEMSWDDLNMAHYNWPSIPEVKAYRNEVRDFVDQLISDLPLDEKGINWNSPWWAIMMGIEHQRIHLETSSVLIRQLPLCEVKQLDIWAICPHSGKAPENVLLPVEGAKLKLGKGFDDPLYGWDNEYGSKDFEVKAFKASQHLVSNGEFLEFVLDGGYDKQAWWTEEGWAWKSYQQAGFPRFWQKDKAGNWQLRTMCSVIEMPWNHPVEVNYLEAKAFCNWKARQTGKPVRLPTEAEWYCLRDSVLSTDQPYWNKAPGNINLEYYTSACPVDEFPFGDFYDVIGNVWQWTETPISAFPGFKIHPYYDDFSVPTFDTRHNLIKGGSFISTGNEAIRASRYAFRRHFYQHAGFRYVESEEPVLVEDNLYEDDNEITPWCELDWGENPLGQSFYKELMARLKPILTLANHGNALAMGCKTGRSAFELAADFTQVTGLDATARFIRLATQMKEKGFIRWVSNVEGEITAIREACLADFGFQTKAMNCEFMQADSANLVAKYSGYDFVLAINVLERSANPKAFLRNIAERLNPEAILVIADGYNWNDSWTPAEMRLGGFRKDGEPYTNLTALNEILRDKFILLQQPFELLQPLKTAGRMWQTARLEVTVWKLIS